MHISIALSLVIATMLVSIRLAPLFLFAPAFGSVRVPNFFRVLFVLAFSCLLVMSLNLDASRLPLELTHLVIAMIGELLIGSAFACGLMITFGAFAFAGRLLDLQIGFGVASLLDLATHSRMPLLGSAMSMFGVMLFYLCDAHHILLKALSFSFVKLPIAKGIAALDITLLLSFSGTIFSMGLALVLPIILILLLIDIGLAVMSRTMPQMNIFVMGISIKVIVGLALLALSIRYVSSVSSKIFELLFKVLERMFG